MDKRINEHSNFMPNKRMPTIYLRKIKFFKAPASIKNHGNYEGGLFDHSLQTAAELLNLTKKLDLRWERPESPYIVGMYHDLCKCDNYRKNHETGLWEYNSNIVIPGHGEKYMDLTEEEITCIRWHMGAYEKDSKMWDYYGRAVEKYPNVLYTHMADMISSKIKNM